MTDLPPGFVLEQPQVPALPAGFQLEGSPNDPTGPAAFNPAQGNNLLPGIGQGMTDAPLGAAQFLMHSPPFSLANAATKFIGGPDIQAQLDAAAKEKAQTDAPLMQTTGGKVGSVIGNAATLAPAAALEAPAALTGIAKLAATGATQGGLAGVAQPVTSDDYAKDKLQQVGTGAALGGVLNPALAGVGKAVQSMLPPNIVASVVNALGNKGSDFAKEGEQLAARTGVDLTPAQVTGSKSQTMLENLARQSIFSRSDAAVADQKIAQQWTDYVGRVIDGVSSGGGSPAEIGSRVQGAVKNAVSDMTQARNTAADADYGQIRTLLQGKPAVVPQNYMATLQDLGQQFAGGPKGSDYEKLASTIGSLQETALQNADLSTLMKTRRFLSQVAGGQVQLAGDTGRGMQKSIATQLLGAIDQDLDASAQKIGGPVGDMLQKANARYRAASQQIEGLQNSALGKLVGQDFTQALGNGTFNQIPGEVVMQRISAMKPSQLESVKGILQQTDPDAWQAVKRSVLEDALKAAQSTPASEGANAVAARPGVFANVMAKTPEDQARLASIFDPGERAQIDDAIATAKRISDRTGTNFSGTAAAAEGYGVMKALGSALYGNLAPAAGLAGQALSMKSIAAIMANSEGRATIKQLASLPPSSDRFRELTAKVTAIAAAQGVDVPTNAGQ